MENNFLNSEREKFWKRYYENPRWTTILKDGRYLIGSEGIRDAVSKKTLILLDSKQVVQHPQRICKEVCWTSWLLIHVDSFKEELC